MNSLFTISSERKYKDGSIYQVFKNYRVYYDEEKMLQFLENIKLQYPQKIRDYGTLDDINALQDFSIIDEIEKSKITKNGKYGVPDIYCYRYKRYPAIYKMLLNSLTAETFSLDIFLEYYKKLQGNGKLSLYYNADLISYFSNKSTEEIKKNIYFENNYDNLKFYNDSEFKMTRKEYKEILKEYLSLIKFKREALSSISVDTMRLAIHHHDYLVGDDLFDDTLIAKKFRKI